MSLGLKYTDRVRVIWWGSRPEPAVAASLEERGFTVEALADDSELPGDLATVQAVVLSDTTDRPRFSVNLAKITVSVMDHGIKVMGFTTAAEFARFQWAVRDWATRMDINSWAEHIDLVSDRPAHEVAHRIAKYSAGPGARPDLKIEGDVAPEDETLLRRAFSDCSEVKLERLDGGHSAQVFLAHATLAQSATGPRPQPFFVKFDTPAKIFWERRNYEERVSGFIPFVNRPNLADGRCLLGVKRGILVGTFVDRSEKFINVAQRGDSPVLLNSLFDDALRGWRQQAFDSAHHSQYASAALASVMDDIDAAYLGTAVDPERIPAARTAMAEGLGLTRKPADILVALHAQPKARFRRGPVHGDLNSGNICSFRGSAILIDFSSAGQGPLVIDPAALEVSLLMHKAAWTGALNGPKPKFAVLRAGWDDIAKCLFEGRYIKAPPPPASSLAPREWLWNCVRQIRMHALSAVCDPDEYRTALAVFLLRVAGYEAKSRSPDVRHQRAMALVLADRVAAQIGAP